MTPQQLLARRPRPRSRPVRRGPKTIRAVQRACEGCGRRLGDATLEEITSAHAPSVVWECPVCTPNPPGVTWTIELPWTSPPLSLNDRGRNPYAKNAKVRQVRQTGRVQAVLARIPPLRRLSAELHYAPRGNRTRDPLNLTATLKALEDGLVDANLVPDDNPTYVQSVMPVIDPPTGRRTGRMWLVIRELPGFPLTLEPGTYEIGVVLE